MSNPRSNRYWHALLFSSLRPTSQTSPFVPLIDIPFKRFVPNKNYVLFPDIRVFGNSVVVQVRCISETICAVWNTTVIVRHVCLPLFCPSKRSQEALWSQLVPGRLENGQLDGVEDPTVAVSQHSLVSMENVLNLERLTAASARPCPTYFFEVLEFFFQLAQVCM